MPKVKFKIILFLLLTCVCSTQAIAQGCFDDVSEAELLDKFSEVKRLQNKAGEQDMDSLYDANKKFLTFLTYQGERNYTIMSDELRFINQGIDFSVSDDNACNIFSWDVYSYLGMHYRSGVLFYKTSTGIRSVQFTNGVAPFSVKDIHLKDGQTVYLVFYEDDYSPKDRFRRVTANVIMPVDGPTEYFLPKACFYESPKDSSSFLEYRYNLESYSRPKNVPAIILSNNKKKLSLPIVKNDGTFEGKYKTYNFDGNKYMLVPTHN